MLLRKRKGRVFPLKRHKFEYGLAMGDMFNVTFGSASAASPHTSLPTLGPLEPAERNAARKDSNDRRLWLPWYRLLFKI